MVLVDLPQTDYLFLLFCFDLMECHMHIKKNPQKPTSEEKRKYFESRAE